MDERARQFITQGDANGAVDPEPVREVQVRGRVWYSVPLVGYAATALDPAHRDLAVKGLAGLLLAYGGWMIVAGACGRGRDRRRAADGANEPVGACASST